MPNKDQTVQMSYVDPVTPIDLPLTASGRATAQIEDGPLTVHRSVLPGGVRLLTESVPGTRAATVGFYVAVGSRDESDSQAGSSHFLEHLLFKGTATRSALEIASAFDSVGGESNAATGKETTHYWAKVLDSDAPMAIATLTDMVTSSLLRDEDIQTERTVIIDELAMSEDTPVEVAHEAFTSALFGKTSLGRPIGGTTESVLALQPDSIRDLYQRRYGSAALIVCAAGSVDHDQISQQVQDALERTSWNLSPDALPEARRSAQTGESWDAVERDVVLRRDIEQAHVLLGGPWLATADPRRIVSSVLLTILGGGVSSRLFQEIREKRGLAYTTYAFDMALADTGLFGMYAGCSPTNLPEVEKIMWGEVERLAESGVPSDELERAKGQLRGGMALGLEDSSSRMGRLARSELMGRFVSVDGSLERIKAVQPRDIMDMAVAMLQQPRGRAVVTSND